MSELKEITFPGALDEFLGKIMAAMVREYAPANNTYVTVLNQCKHLDARLQAANKTIENLKLRLSETTDKQVDNLNKRLKGANETILSLKLRIAELEKTKQKK